MLHSRSTPPRPRRRRTAPVAPISIRAAAGLAALVALAALASASACASRPAVTTPSGGAPDSATTLGTVVTLHQEGGIAGIVTDATVDGGTRRYRTVTRHFCAPAAASGSGTGGSCPPPIDSASGSLSDSLAASVAAAVDAANFFSLRRDYGTDPRLRDGFVYLVTVRRGARSASVRADDTTRPPALATLQGEVAEVVRRARGK